MKVDSNEFEPYNVKYLAYQRGFIQDRFNGVQFTLSQVWKLKNPKQSQKGFRKLAYNQQVRKVSKYFPSDIVKDLKMLGRIRNEWLKHDQINYDKIIGLLYNLSSLNIRLPKDKSKFNEFKAYRYSFLAINTMTITLSNIDPLRSFWLNMKETAK